MKTLYTENTWVQKKVVPNLNVQIIYMDKPYMMTGEDRIILTDEGINSGTTEKDKNVLMYSYDSDGLIIFNLETDIYCYFDYNLNAIRYEHTQEFTDKFNRSNRVSAFYIPENTFGTIVRLK